MKAPDSGGEQSPAASGDAAPQADGETHVGSDDGDQKSGQEGAWSKHKMYWGSNARPRE